jgi:redox-sensitive bicupin YhaK (pirin superfamily)
MISVRRAAERGLTRQNRLESRHTFSFARYYDPDHMGFHCLRVLNEEVLAGGRGYEAHPHKNMEILLYVVEGELQHVDSLDGERILGRGEVRCLSAGTGITHSEINHHGERPCRMIQAWFEPQLEELRPCGSGLRIDPDFDGSRLWIVASPDGRDGTVQLNQDVHCFVGRVREGERVKHFLDPGRAAWVQVLQGRVDVNHKHLEAGDGAAIEDLTRSEVLGRTDAELLLFDLP